MIEIIHDHRMSLRDSSIRHFIIHKGTIILLSHFLSFYFKRFKVATVHQEMAGRKVPGETGIHWRFELKETGPEDRCGYEP